MRIVSSAFLPSNHRKSDRKARAWRAACRARSLQQFRHAPVADLHRLDQPAADHHRLRADAARRRLCRRHTDGGRAERRPAARRRMAPRRPGICAARRSPTRRRRATPQTATQFRSCSSRRSIQAQQRRSADHAQPAGRANVRAASPSGGRRISCSPATRRGTSRIATASRSMQLAAANGGSTTVKLGQRLVIPGRSTAPQGVQVASLNPQEVAGARSGGADAGSADRRRDADAGASRRRSARRRAAGRARAADRNRRLAGAGRAASGRREQRLSLAGARPRHLRLRQEAERRAQRRHQPRGAGRQRRSRPPRTAR